jgi:hypothetical protein
MATAAWCFNVRRPDHRLDTAAGEFAATGHPLFTIIIPEHW